MKLIMIWVVVPAITSCASAVKNTISLEDTFAVKTPSKKATALTDNTATAEAITDKQGNQSLRVLVGSNQNTFAANYVDEYLYYFDLFLSGAWEPGVDFGDAHTFSALSRMNFHTSEAYPDLLGIRHCSFGGCDDYSSLFYYDKSEVSKLRAYLSRFQSQHGKPVERFEPPVVDAKKALIVVYRLNTAPLGGKAKMNIIDGKQQDLAMNVAPNSCQYFEVNPGELKFQVKGGGISGIKAANYSIHVKAGTVSYVQYSSAIWKKPDASMQAMMKIYFDRKTFRTVPEPVAVNDFSTCEKL